MSRASTANSATIWLSCGIFHALRVVQAPDALHIAPQSEFAAGAIVKQARELGLPGPGLWRNDHGGNHRAGRSRRRRDRSEGYHRRSRPQQREGPGSARQLQGTLQLRHFVLAPRLCLGRRIHRGGVSQADQRRPGSRRIPRLSVRDHLERRSWEQLQLR